jgi:hypothetical protein
MVEVPECTREDGSTASAMDKAPLNSLFDHAGISCVAKTVTEDSQYYGKNLDAVSQELAEFQSQ